MNRTPQLSEQDLILLNSYLDGRLTQSERASVEARLSQDAGLRSELESLQQTIALLKMAERVPVPRSFTLDPARYAKSSRSFWNRIGLTTVPAWAAAAISVVVVLVCAGAFVLGSGLVGGGASAPNVAMQAVPAATEAPLESAAQQAFEAAATQAPAEALTESMDAARSSVPEAAGAAPMQPTPAVALPQYPSGGGLGGGAPEAGFAPSPYPQPTLGAPSGEIPPGAAAKSGPMTQSQATEQANIASTVVSPSALMAAAPTETPARIAVTEAKPFEGLKGSSWIILGVGSLALFIAIFTVIMLMRRRPR